MALWAWWGDKDGDGDLGIDVMKGRRNLMMMFEELDRVRRDSFARNG